MTTPAYQPKPEHVYSEHAQTVIAGALMWLFGTLGITLLLHLPAVIQIGLCLLTPTLYLAYAYLRKDKIRGDAVRRVQQEHDYYTAKYSQE